MECVQNRSIAQSSNWAVVQLNGSHDWHDNVKSSYQERNDNDCMQCLAKCQFELWENHSKDANLTRKLTFVSKQKRLEKFNYSGQLLQILKFNSKLQINSPFLGSFELLAWFMFHKCYARSYNCIWNTAAKIRTNINLGNYGEIIELCGLFAPLQY